MPSLRRLLRRAALIVGLAVAATLGGCEAPAVYGSVGFSSYSGYGGFGSSISMGGRIL